jgi:hypothetical protein
MILAYSKYGIAIEIKEDSIVSLIVEKITDASQKLSRILILRPKEVMESFCCLKEIKP